MMKSETYTQLRSNKGKDANAKACVSGLPSLMTSSVCSPSLRADEPGHLSLGDLNGLRLR